MHKLGKQVNHNNTLLVFMINSYNFTFNFKHNPTELKSVQARSQLFSSLERG